MNEFHRAAARAVTTILTGDVRERLAELPPDSFDCIVTSPPYWGLRDYGTAKWEGGDAECDHKAPSRFDYPLNSGLGPTGVQNQASNAGSGSVQQFRNVCGKCGARRIDNQIGLEPTLTEYLDTMVSVCRELRRVLKPSGTFWLNVGDCYSGSTMTGGNAVINASGGDLGFKQLRQFKKPRCESGLKPKDLCMMPNRLAIRLQEDGWYVRSEIIWHKPNPMPESVTDRPTSSHEKIWLLTKSGRYAYAADAISEASVYPGDNRAERTDNRKALEPFCFDNGSRARTGMPTGETRNARNVWTIATQPYSEAHFATFPPELAERCIKAGCPAGGHVLDPFGGAGTTALVAHRLHRSCTMIELNSAYVQIARNRLSGDGGMFANIITETGREL